MRIRQIFTILMSLSLTMCATIPQGPAMTDTEKIAEASLAASPEITANATFLDWPSEKGGDFRVMREGTNGWICLPDPPMDDANFEPHCHDEEWMNFIKAFVSGEAPDTKKVGLSYMLNSRWSVGNISPEDKAATPDNQWHKGGSHLMLIVPDPALLDAFPTEPTPEGGAYIMWKGNPYEHLMIPIPEAHAN